MRTPTKRTKIDTIALSGTNAKLLKRTIPAELLRATARALSFIVIFVVITLLLARDTPAQSVQDIEFITEAEVSQSPTIIAVKVASASPINRIRLFSETSGKSMVIEVPKSKIVILNNIELEDGENIFNWIGYKDNSMVFASSAPFIIKKTNPNGRLEKPQETSSGQTQRVRERNESRLVIVNKPEVSNQSFYRLKLDAGKMPPNTGKYVVKVTNGEKSVEEKVKINIDAKTNKPAALQEIGVRLFEGKNTITICPEIDGKQLADFTAQIEINCVNCEDSVQSTSFRAVIGLEQTGASSANSKQSPFLNFSFNTPITVGKKSILCPKNDSTCKEGTVIGAKSVFDFSIWGDLKFTTTPVQTFDALSNFTPATFAGNFLTTGGTGKVNDLVQSFEFLVGVEKQIIPPGGLFRGILPGRTSVSLIAAGGATSPLTSEKTATFYKIPRVNNGMDIDPRFLEAFPEAAGKTNVAFVSPARDKFYRQYFGGFRVKTFFEDENGSRYFPAMFDVMFGQNEIITNKLKGVILRLDGSTPLPIKNAGFLYIFGSAQMKLGRTVNQRLPSFFLEPVTNASLTSNDTVIIPIDRSPFLLSNRDIYRIGVGIDLLRLFDKKEEK